jgi:predicted RNA-binding protein Jag
MNAPEHVEWRTIIQYADNEVLRPLLRAIGIDAYVEIRHREEGTILSLEHATESGRLIGRDGHTLEAIQYLVNALVDKRFGPTRAVLIDCAGYRERYKANLERKAKAAARKVQETREPVTLEPMVAADRRVVHTALRDWSGIETVSVDEDAETGTKRVQVFAVDAAAARADAAEPAAAEPAVAEPAAGDEPEHDADPLPPPAEDEDAPATPSPPHDA